MSTGSRISTTPIAPNTRTSATVSSRAAGLNSSFNWLSIAFMRSCQGELSRRRRLASATEQASGLPINVGPCIKHPATPLQIWSAMLLWVQVADRVIYPPVRALPIHIISGTTPACSAAKNLPVLPKPVAISSKITNIPASCAFRIASTRYWGW